MSKNLSILFFVFAFSAILPFNVSASSGACSYHGGVDCARTDFSDGSVVCNDGWKDSKIMFNDMLKCNQKTSCPLYLDDQGYSLLKTSYEGYINSIKKSSADSCIQEQQRKINYISQSEDICRKYETSLKTSAMMSGREYTERDCAKQEERRGVENSYQLCIGAIDGNTNLYWAMTQLSCLKKESERDASKDLFCKTALVNAYWNSSTKKCECNEGSEILSDGKCGNIFAQTLSKAFKNINSSTSTSVSSKKVPISNNETISSVLRVGSRGAEVKNLQRKLGVDQTGYFGNYTRSAVIKFQRENNLPMTGVVGKLTLEKLNLIK